MDWYISKWSCERHTFYYDNHSHDYQQLTSERGGSQRVPAERWHRWAHGGTMKRLYKAHWWMSLNDPGIRREAGEATSSPSSLCSLTPTVNERRKLIFERPSASAPISAWGGWILRSFWRFSTICLSKGESASAGSPFAWCTARLRSFSLSLSL